MNSLIPDAMAQAAGGAPAGGGLTPFIMMAVFVVIFYFLLIRPQQKKQKEHQAMLGKIAAGDEVDHGRRHPRPHGRGGRSIPHVEIADNVRIKVQRFQVTSLVPKGTLKGA